MPSAAHSLFSRLLPKEDRDRLTSFFASLREQEKKHLQQGVLRPHFRAFCEGRGWSEEEAQARPIREFLRHLPELLVGPDRCYLMHRPEIAKYAFYTWSYDGEVEEISPRRYLQEKDWLVLGVSEAPRQVVEIDFAPFEDYAPSMWDSHRIGDGIRFLNRHLSSSLFQHPEKWKGHLFEFLTLHRYGGQQLLINGGAPKTVEAFQGHLRDAIRWLERQPAHQTYEEVASELRQRGFQPGWGDTVARIRESLSLLQELLEAPASELLAAFIERIPMIFQIAVISPHGWFAQENALGKPDTGGQVIYILEQVRALEAGLRRGLRDCGLAHVEPRILVVTRLIPEAEDTTCDQRLEKIDRTANAHILRVPFREKDGEVVPQWLPRFEVWPYLDRFARDAQEEIFRELGRSPDLIIGNYSDGNLVATLLSDELDVIQCTVAHALEKTKYEFSDLYWERMEDDYHFSQQFTADLIAMNKSDFVIASTYQEIAGTEHSIGQYESYEFFTLPGLYRVVNGVNLFNPRFNIVPPGVDETIYCPYFELTADEDPSAPFWRDRLFEAPAEDIFGHLDDPTKPPLFTMARFDRIKNITGLIEAYGQSEILRQSCNLIFAAGSFDEAASSDREERDQIRRAHQLIEEYQLTGQIRWLPKIAKTETGAAYRAIAERRGVFVQPALYEGFGLTVLEAMLSGLPTFATKFGGPAEIIRHGENGFLMNTSQPDLIAEVLEAFWSRAQAEEEHWEQISRAGVERVRSLYTWTRYSDKLITLTKLYGFWRYAVAGKGMEKIDRYCDLLYQFLLKQRAER